MAHRTIFVQLSSPFRGTLGFCLAIVSLVNCRHSEPSSAPPRGASSITVSHATETALDAGRTTVVFRDGGALADSAVSATDVLRSGSFVDNREVFQSALRRLLTDPVAVDPSPAGVLLVRFLSPSADGRSGARRSARRVCGRASGRDTELRELLRNASAQSQALGQPVCDANECVIAGMEHAPTYRFRFALADGGAVQWVSVYQLNESALDPQWMQSLERFVTTSEQTVRCPR